MNFYQVAYQNSMRSGPARATSGIDLAFGQPTSGLDPFNPDITTDVKTLAPPPAVGSRLGVIKTSKATGIVPGLDVVTIGVPVEVPSGQVVNVTVDWKDSTKPDVFQARASQTYRVAHIFDPSVAGKTVSVGVSTDI